MHQLKTQNKNKQHEPVLLNEVLQYLNPKRGESYLDLTAGYGGHALSVLARTGSLRRAVLVDRDSHAVEQLKKLFKQDTVGIWQQDFYSASQQLHAECQKFDLILADLGVSSPHLNEGSRGFSISQAGPLDMRMDQSQELSAEAITNNFSEAALTELIKQYGEEPMAKKIAQAIVKSRPLKATNELAEIIAGVVPRRGRIHPATKTFQALRIAVNDEINLLKQSLPLWLDLLSPGGRIAIISFHSLEDRLVKQVFKEASGPAYDATLNVLTKRPIIATPQEIAHNPRARSAKLRAAAKIKKKGN